MRKRVNNARFATYTQPGRAEGKTELRARARERKVVVVVNPRRVGFAFRRAEQQARSGSTRPAGHSRHGQKQRTTEADAADNGIKRTAAPKIKTRSPIARGLLADGRALDVNGF